MCIFYFPTSSTTSRELRLVVNEDSLVNLGLKETTIIFSNYVKLLWTAWPNWPYCYTNNRPTETNILPCLKHLYMFKSPPYSCFVSLHVFADAPKVLFAHSFKSPVYTYFTFHFGNFQWWCFTYKYVTNISWGTGNCSKLLAQFF